MPTPLSQPFSAPVIPVQPEQDVYGPDALQLFTTYTRDSFRSAFGQEAPAWDPSRPTKTWFDSTAVSSSTPTVHYDVISPDSAGAWGVRGLDLAVQEAAAVNLPGQASYPVYVVAPTGATRGGAPLNPLFFSLEADARMLLQALGGSQLIDEGASNVFPVEYPADEPRRQWAVVIGGRAFNCGELLRMKNANGIGAPGAWTMAAMGPAWQAATLPPSGLDDPRPMRPVPVRKLLGNERLQPGLMGIGAVVVRTDRVAASQSQGGFGPMDRLVLLEIRDLLKNGH
jgi:hypothetical protein